MEQLFSYLAHPITILSAGIVSSAIFFLSTLIHGYWTLGGKIGLAAAVPEEDGKFVYYMTPMSIFAIMFVSLLAGVVMLGRIGLFSDLQPEFIYRWLPWVSAAIFTLRAVGDFRYSGLFKKVKVSAFAYWDNLVVTPLCIINALASLVVALSPFPAS
jgi:hypothetical protein